MKNLVLRSIVLLCVIFTITSCDNRLSNEELTEQVKQNMLGEGGQYREKDIEIESLILVREGKNSNNYNGVLKTKEPYGEFTYGVKVTYDGETFAWVVSEVQ